MGSISKMFFSIGSNFRFTLSGPHRFSLDFSLRAENIFLFYFLRPAITARCFASTRVSPSSALNRVIGLLWPMKTIILGDGRIMRGTNILVRGPPVAQQETLSNAGRATAAVEVGGARECALKVTGFTPRPLGESQHLTGGAVDGGGRAGRVKHSAAIPVPSVPSVVLPSGAAQRPRTEGRRRKTAGV